MTYKTARDILPEILDATEKGNLKWEAQGPSDYVVRIGNNKVEIERTDVSPDENSQPEDAIIFYVWNSKNEVVSSYVAMNYEPEFQEFLEYYNVIRNNCLDVENVLSEIVKNLKR